MRNEVYRSSIDTLFNRLKTSAYQKRENTLRFDADASITPVYSLFRSLDLIIRLMNSTFQDTREKQWFVV